MDMTKNYEELQINYETCKAELDFVNKKVELNMNKLKESIRSGRKIDTSNIDDQLNFDEIEKDMEKS